PTRVIDVGDEHHSPHVYLPKHGETGTYLTLSHRWGSPHSQHRKLITKTTNIEQYRRGIELDSFPFTFRHALEITRALGIRYIWIDSLCILQDDKQDWERESARMGDIYSH